MVSLPRLPGRSKSRLLALAMGVADWLVRTQCRSEPPCWDANQGRFLYTRHRPSGREVLGIGWSQARAIVVLLTAYQVSMRAKYRDAVERAADYLRGMQQTDSPHPLLAGIVWEEIPHSAHVYVRDASEVAETFCYLYRATGDPEWLWRAERYWRWYRRFGVNEQGWPLRDVLIPSGRRVDKPGSYQIGNGKFLYRLWQATGKPSVLTRGLKPIIRRATAEFFDPGGGLLEVPGVRSSAQAKMQELHHAGRGREAHLTFNDDGAGATLLAAFHLFRDASILECLERYAAWILSHAAPLPTYTAYLAMANFLLDLYRQTGRKEYLQWILDNLDAGLLRLRVQAKRDADYGAFVGEDEPTKGYFGGRAQDYVCMRTNAYAAMLLLKLAGAQHWCPGYSAFGWEQLRPWPRRRKRKAALP